MFDKSRTTYAREDYPNPPPGVADEDYLDHLVNKHQHQLDSSRAINLPNLHADAWNIEYPHHRVSDHRMMLYALRYYANAASKGTKKAPSMAVAACSTTHSRVEFSALHKNSGPPRRTNEQKALDEVWRQGLTTVTDEYGNDFTPGQLERHAQYQCGEKPALRPFFDDPSKAGPDQTVYTLALDKDYVETAFCANCDAWVVSMFEHRPKCRGMRIVDSVVNAVYPSKNKHSSQQDKNRTMNSTIHSTAPTSQSRSTPWPTDSAARHVQSGSAFGLGFSAQPNLDPYNARNMGSTSQDTNRPSTSYAPAEGGPYYAIAGPSVPVNPQMYPASAPYGQPSVDQYNARFMYANAQELSGHSQVPISQQPHTYGYPALQGQGLLDPNFIYTQQGVNYGATSYPNAMGQWPPPAAGQ